MDRKTTRSWGLRLGALVGLVVLVFGAGEVTHGQHLFFRPAKVAAVHAKERQDQARQVAVCNEISAELERMMSLPAGSARRTAIQDYRKTEVGDGVSLKDAAVLDAMARLDVALIDERAMDETVDGKLKARALADACRRYAARVGDGAAPKV